VAGVAQPTPLRGTPVSVGRDSVDPLSHSSLNLKSHYKLRPRVKLSKTPPRALSPSRPQDRLHTPPKQVATSLVRIPSPAASSFSAFSSSPSRSPSASPGVSPRVSIVSSMSASTPSLCGPLRDSKTLVRPQRCGVALAPRTSSRASKRKLALNGSDMDVDWDQSLPLTPHEASS
jgi:hypothetical protein